MSFLNKKTIGLDISDSTIEVVLVDIDKKGPRVISRNQTNLELGVVQDGKIADELKLKEAIKNLLETAEPEAITEKDIVFGLPESKVFLHSFRVAKDKLGSIEEIADQKAKYNFPIKEDNLFYDYKILSQDKDGADVLVAGTSIDVLNEWSDFFKKIGLEIKIFDIETLASFRGIFMSKPSKTVCVIDMGSNTSNVAVFNKKGLVYSYTSYIAGKSIDLELVKELKLKTEEVVEMREKINLSAKKDTKVAKVFKAQIDNLVIELKEVWKYLKTKETEVPSEIVLIGGLSQTKGIDAYLQKALNITTSIGSVVEDDSTPPLRFIGAIGMALRGLEDDWNKKDPGFDPDELKKFIVNIKKKKNKVKSRQYTEKDTKKRENLLSKSKENREKRKVKTQIIAFAAIVLIGSVLLGVLYNIQSDKRAKRSAELEKSLINFEVVQTFSVKIPVATDKSEFAEDRVSGRVILTDIDSAPGYESAKKKAESNAEDKLNDSEVLWDEPLNPVNDEENITFPLEFQWLVFPEEKVNENFEIEASKLIGDQEYALSNILKTGVESTDNPNIWFLVADVTLSLEEEVYIEDEIDIETVSTTIATTTQ